jgi:tripartite-type tricarboxylate transporter receptor subunit TctC
MAPAGTPAPALRRLNAELVAIIRSPAMRESLWNRQWIDPVGSTPEELTAIIRRESERWADTVKAAGLQPD